MNAKIVKSVVIGESFIEHRFDPFVENFEGTWIKSGHKVEFNATNEGTVCDSCLIDQFKRKKNWSAVHSSASFKTHSYQVPGITLPSDYYEWYIGRCFNGKTCWGNKRRAFQVKREGSRYLFSSCVVHPHSRETLGRYVGNVTSTNYLITLVF